MMHIGFVDVFNDSPRDLLADRLFKLDQFYMLCKTPSVMTKLLSTTARRRTRYNSTNVQRFGVLTRHLHIFRIEYGPYGEMFAVIKTHVLVHIQRAWKRYMASRNSIVRDRMKLSSLRVLERTGKYPVGCRYLPHPTFI